MPLTVGQAKKQARYDEKMSDQIQMSTYSPKHRRSDNKQASHTKPVDLIAVDQSGYFPTEPRLEQEAKQKPHAKILEWLRENIGKEFEKNSKQWV